MVGRRVNHRRVKVWDQVVKCPFVYPCTSGGRLASPARPTGNIARRAGNTARGEYIQRELTIDYADERCGLRSGSILCTVQNCRSMDR